MKGVQLTSNGEINIVDLVLDSIDINTKGTLQYYVNGYIETVPTRLIPYENILLILNEDGKIMGLPMNTLATILSRIGSDYIAGDVIIAGYGKNSQGEPDIIGFNDEFAKQISGIVKVIKGS